MIPSGEEPSLSREPAREQVLIFEMNLSFKQLLEPPFSAYSDKVYQNPKNLGIQVTVAGIKVIMISASNSTNINGMVAR